MFCKSCGKELPDGAKFCGRCGTKQSVPPPVEPVLTKTPPVSARVCPQCGAELKANGNFCGKCGAKAAAALPDRAADRGGKTEAPPRPAQPDPPPVVKLEKKPPSVMASRPAAARAPSAVPLPPPQPVQNTASSGSGAKWAVPVLSCLLCLSLGLTGGFLLWQRLNGDQTDPPAQPDHEGQTGLPTQMDPDNMASTDPGTQSAALEPPPRSITVDSASTQSSVPSEQSTEKAAALPQETAPAAEPERYRWDSERITEGMLRQMDRESIMWMRNEIYARHGYQFIREDIQAHFDQKDWYQPNPNYSDSLLSQLERENIDTIVLYEKAQGWRK